MKEKIKSLNSGLIGLGILAGMSGILFGGMKKMFGENNTKEIVSAMVESFIAMLEVKLEEIKGLEEKNKELMKKLEETIREKEELKVKKKK